MPRKKSQSFTDDSLGQARDNARHSSRHLRRYQSYDAHTAPPVPVLDVPEGEQEEGVDPVYSMLRRLGGHSKQRSVDSGDGDFEPEPHHHQQQHHHHHHPQQQQSIELLSPKQNGGGGGGGGGASVEVVESSGTSSSSKGKSGSIRGMWKKAFKSLKKDSPNSSSSSKSKGGTPTTLTPAASDSGSLSEKAGATLPEEKKYQRMTSRQSSLKKGLLKRKDSKEKEMVLDDQVDLEPIAPAEIDPVYSLLKCAADLPRHSKGGGSPQALPGHHACCMRSALSSDNNQLTSNNNTTAPSGGGGRSNSRSSSPSSSDPYLKHDFSLHSLSLDVESASSLSVSAASSCTCPCHTPEVLEKYHAPLLSAMKYYLPKT